MKTKCTECDERGYIADTEYSSHSCPCGWAIEQDKIKFNKFFGSDPIEQLDNLLSYGRARAEQKGKLIK